jgi:hypothetical protein
MSEITDKLIFELIKHHYRPYDTHEEFGRGFSACQAGNSRNPHEADSISAQAWRSSPVMKSRWIRACLVR